MNSISIRNFFLIAALLLSVSCAGTSEKYHNAEMDFGSIQSVAVMPFLNLSKDQMAGDRVRDVFMTSLLATEGVYVIPAGEVAKGIGIAGLTNPFTPSKEDVMKFGSVVKVDAVITGVLREYGEVRSGSAASNVISLSLQMMEIQTGKVIWAASVTRGGITLKERLLGGGGEPMNDVTKKAVDELINKLFI
jgi:hypothetical protein